MMSTEISLCANASHWIRNNFSLHASQGTFLPVDSVVNYHVSTCVVAGDLRLIARKRSRTTQPLLENMGFFDLGLDLTWLL